MNNRLALILIALTIGSCTQAMVYIDENSHAEEAQMAEETSYEVASYIPEEERPVRKSVYDHASNWPSDYAKASTDRHNAYEEELN